MERRGLRAGGGATGRAPRMIAEPMKLSTRHLTPSGFVGGIRNVFFRWLARNLQQYLANTPLTWGDPARIAIGRGVVLTNAVLNCRSGRIVIEDDVFFAHNCMVLTGKHEYALTGKARTDTVVDKGRDIIIRRGAWIASGTIIIGPCEIGENAVIGAGSVVLGDVMPGTLYAGNPARPIREIVRAGDRPSPD